MRTQKQTLLAILLITATFSITALDVSITPPQVDTTALSTTIPGIDSTSIANIETATNNQLNNLGTFESELKTLFQAYEDKTIGTGFSNAGVFATSGVTTQRALTDISFIAVSAGTMVGAQIPSSGFPTSATDYINKLSEGESSLMGLAWQLAALEASLNSGFLLKGLTLGTKLTAMQASINTDSTDIKYSSWIAGATARYQLIPSLNLIAIKWTGINLGSGLIFSGQTYNIKPKLDTIDGGTFSGTVDLSGSNMGIANLSGTMSINPDITINIDSFQTIIPLEVITGIKLLGIVQLSGGAGADIAIGKTDLSLKDNSTITVSPSIAGTSPTPYSYNIPVTPGNIEVNSSTQNTAPTLFMPKMMLDLMLSIGPIYMDIPATLYFNQGMGGNLGITIGILL
ncbi:hypothetical protein WKV44_09820 [Spirochaetia bacterium 38H-sp]|uniref:Uncharacterized protein n=1 Tax=Rarispira pelagica TaxID=3141764 RepID=A0ABU9UDT6_9SPIR